MSTAHLETAHAFSFSGHHQISLVGVGDGEVPRSNVPGVGGGIPLPPDISPPMDRQTPVKTLPSCNLVGGRKQDATSRFCFLERVSSGSMDAPSESELSIRFRVFSLGTRLSFPGGHGRTVGVRALDPGSPLRLCQNKKEILDNCKYDVNILGLVYNE